MNKILDLVLKDKWYDMIAAGIKREEYREIKPYWTKRIARGCQLCKGQSIMANCMSDCTLWLYEVFNFNYFTNVRFHRGYTSTTMTFEVMEITIDTGFPEWGAEPGKLYYVIRLGKFI